MWVWAVLIRISPTRCIWLVHIVKNQVGIIQNKWGRCEIWIHIQIERIVIVEFHFTNNHKQKRKSKQQTKRKEKIKTKPILRLTRPRRLLTGRLPGGGYCMNSTTS